MFGTLLIANRGEIACRIARTARRLGIATVAVYSDADRGARHVREADRALWIGPAPAADSYLDGRRIIAAARAAGADAIHPGYGFLSESAAFAEACGAAGIVFVGPSPEAMRRVGDKASARALAQSIGVPVVPGSDGSTEDATALARDAERIGLPVMIKAAAGGGGRGMRRVEMREDLGVAIASARREAVAAFGDGRLLVERAVHRPRHIEIQVLGDRYGRLVHLFERECSLQRHHQKIVEEAPAPGMSAGLRQRLVAAALALARVADYHNAGTFEFLVEGGGLGADAVYYFIEANPRLQVEHPVTEAITGLDLVAWQLKVAAGEPLPLTLDRVAIDGHAVEVRICAEDPEHGHRPQAGRIVEVRTPHTPAMRVESGVEDGAAVPPEYDSLLLKAIAHGPDRDGALARLGGWLRESAVLGVATNLGLLRTLVAHPEVGAGRLDTGLVARVVDAAPQPQGPPGAATACGVHLLIEAAARGGATPDDAPPGPWEARDGFQLGPPRVERRQVIANGTGAEVAVRWGAGGAVVRAAGVDYPANPVAAGMAAVYDRDGARALVWDGFRHLEVHWPRDGGAQRAVAAAGGVVAPITGRVARLAVAAGQHVVKGTVVAIVEAMKMEHVIVAPRGGRVMRVHTGEGAQVSAGAPLADIDPEEG